MAQPRLSKLELQIMDALWNGGAQSVREIQEAFPAAGRPAYTTVQTMVYRLEQKNALRRVRKIGNAHIFEAIVSQASAYRNYTSGEWLPSISPVLGYRSGVAFDYIDVIAP